MSEHILQVLEVDEYGHATFEITQCTEGEECAVWHECGVNGCQPPEDDDEAHEGVIRHGQRHQFIDYSWMAKDIPHNCAAHYIEELESLDQVGHYSFDVDYLGDGQWYAVGLERITQ